jgi:hypothetical protein
MLSMSGLLEYMEKDVRFEGKVIYRDPAYGTSDFLCCPFPLATSGSVQAEFNARMSSVREAVEWVFGRVKTLLSFINWDKKIRVRQTPVGKLFFVAALLTNCHTCLQPIGNQISMYFGVRPPTLTKYLCS